MTEVPDNLTTAELARRWQISERTIARWRDLGIGPPWLQLNRRIRYRLEDVLDFERVHLRRA